IYKILESAGKKVLLAGNIGLPMLDILEKSSNCDFVALELSSFQLSDLNYSPHISVCLMIVPEHLNWHENMDDYLDAKSNVFIHQKSDDVAIYNELNENSKMIVSKSVASTKIGYAVPESNSDNLTDSKVYVKSDSIYYQDTKVCDVSDVKLL